MSTIEGPRGSSDLSLAELPVSAKFAGGDRVYLKIAPNAAVEVRFGRNGEMEDYGLSIPLSEFPDVRFHPMNGPEIAALQAQHRSPTYSAISSISQRLGDILHRLLHRSSSAES
ncbi:MAG: hypothetical protein ABIG34_01715 [Candidatus Peregrinibacteria bacterium]